MSVPDGTVPSFSHRERFAIVLGIAVIIFSAIGIFGAESNVFFFCLMTLGIVSIIVYQQIRELQLTASTLHESEERFRLLVQEIQEYAIFALGDDGLIATWNQGAERIVGYSSDEIIGKPFYILRANGDGTPELLSQILAKARDSGRHYEEVWCVTKDCRRFLTNTVIAPLRTQRGKWRGFCVVMGDITEKKQAERELLESYRFIERITHTIPNILFIQDLSSGQTTYVNEEAETILGYRPEAGKSEVTFLDSVLHPDDKIQYSELRKRSAVLQDGEIVEVTWRMKHVSGEWRWLSCRIVVFARTPVGVPHQLLGIGQDVTALRQSQEEAKRMEHAALNRQRLAMLGELSAGVAHEIRNPLQGILSCVEDLRNQCAENARLASTISLLEDGLQRMDQISARLLRLARNQDGEKAPSDIEQCLEGTFAFVRTRAQKSQVTLVSEVAPGLPKVPMHAERISEALLNLLNNALDACSPGGSIRVSARMSSVQGMVDLSITDTGSGISPQAQDRIFEAFFTTKAPGKGTGLGMTIVRKNVEAHGGRIELVETSPNGTTFRILLPID